MTDLIIQRTTTNPVNITFEGQEEEDRPASYIVDLDYRDRFAFHPTFERYISEQPYDFGFEGVGAASYYRSYANPMPNGGTESWPDTVLRMITGGINILKWHMLRNRLRFDEDYWDQYAMQMAESALKRQWLPAGRMVQHVGKEVVYERGAAFTQNCAYVKVENLSTDAHWLMDMALCGVGIGFSTQDYHGELMFPAEQTRTYVIPDTREGWALSVRELIRSYEQGSEKIEFDYSLIRPAGSPIRSIGGVASGPEPLRIAHERLRQVLTQYAAHAISSVRVVCDVMNIIGAAVVAGGQRRTALIALGDPDNEEFRELKNYGDQDRKTGEWLTKGPAFDRLSWGWASNNSIVLRDHDDFKQLPAIADHIRNNGEPGVLNMLNINRYGRFGEEDYGVDHAVGINPCGEQPLENKEVCCLSEVYYTNCRTTEEFNAAIEYATMYASIVTLLPTHNPETNAKISKNRRIGVSISGVAESIQKEASSHLIRKLRNGYRIARQVNKEHAERCGVPQSVRVTTVKPSGTTSLVAGSSPGVHYPMYGRYIRRMRIQNQSPVLTRLIEAGYPYEPDVYDMNSTVVEFPVNLGPIRGQGEVSMWTKGALAGMMQEHWSDNAVSVTVSFNPKTEGDQVEDFLAFNMSRLKSISMLPEKDEGAYPQMPYEEITLKEYERRKAQIRLIDWRGFEQGQVELERFCDGATCTI